MTEISIFRSKCEKGGSLLTIINFQISDSFKACTVKLRSIYQRVFIVPILHELSVIAIQFKIFFKAVEDDFM